jgi:hypothetical protein
MTFVALVRTLPFAAFPPRQKAAGLRIGQPMQELQEAGGK